MHCSTAPGNAKGDCTNFRFRFGVCKVDRLTTFVAVIVHNCYCYYTASQTMSTRIQDSMFYKCLFRRGQKKNNETQLLSLFDNCKSGEKSLIFLDWGLLLQLQWNPKGCHAGFFSLWLQNKFKKKNAQTKWIVTQLLTSLSIHPSIRPFIHP